VMDLLLLWIVVPVSKFKCSTVLRKQNRMSAFRSKIQLKRECGMVRKFPHTILKNEKRGSSWSRP
jgi:hypothetical protein